MHASPLREQAQDPGRALHNHVGANDAFKADAGGQLDIVQDGVEDGLGEVAVQVRTGTAELGHVLGDELISILMRSSRLLSL